MTARIWHGRRGRTALASLAALALAAGLAVAAVPAHADRAARAADATAILAAESIDAACGDVRVSTVDARWARVRVTKHGGDCPTDLDWVLAHREQGTWVDRGRGGGQGECGGEDGLSHASGIPQRVAEDLGICARRRPQTAKNSGILCSEIEHNAADGDLEIENLKTAPADCDLSHWPKPDHELDPAGRGRLTAITWAGWGTRRARGTATDPGTTAAGTAPAGTSPGTTPVGTTPPAAPIAVRFAAWRPRPNDCDGYTYTRVTLRYPGQDPVTLALRPLCVV